MKWDCDICSYRRKSKRGMINGKIYERRNTLMIMSCSVGKKVLYGF